MWNIERTENKRELALKLGAERTFLPGEDLAKYVDAVFDTSGDWRWARSIKRIKPGGSIVTSRMHSGRSVSFMSLAVEQISIRGVYAETLDEFQDLMSSVTAKDIVPHVGQVLSMLQALKWLKNLKDEKTREDCPDFIADYESCFSAQNRKDIKKPLRKSFSILVHPKGEALHINTAVFMLE